MMWIPSLPSPKPSPTPGQVAALSPCLRFVVPPSPGGTSFLLGYKDKLSQVFKFFGSFHTGVGFC